MVNPTSVTQVNLDLAIARETFLATGIATISITLMLHQDRFSVGMVKQERMWQEAWNTALSNKMVG